MMKTKSLEFRNTCLLLLTAVIWGVAFVAQSEGGKAIGPYSYNCIRSFVGSFVLIPVIFFLDRLGLTGKKPTSPYEKRRLLKAGVLCGLFLCLASNFQQVGITLGTYAGKAGFLTTCYILIVPIMGLFFHKRCGLNIWIAVCVALVGLYFLCIKTSGVQDSGSFIAFSDVLVIICSFLFSIQIMLVDHYSPLVDGVRMASIEFFTVGVLTSIPMFIIELHGDVRQFALLWTQLQTWDALIPILYGGVMSCGVAYTLQIVGQNGLNPTVASLLMSCEALFSVLAGWLILKQALGLYEIMGCVLIFIAIILAQLNFNNAKQSSVM